ncbi:MAG: radical SAM protein [Clostridia bacterium]|nr:radical SAM protein [Clostridia bacterium]
MNNKCTACPRECNINRKTDIGFCGVSDTFRIARAALHYWEEPCISGTNGSGTVFFSGCNLKCVYCQNFELSHNAFGKDITDERLSEIFDELVSLGAHNINLVNPTHYAIRLAEMLKVKKPSVPIVYNTGGFEKNETLKMLDGIVDIYLTDLKYCDDKVSLKYSKAENYFENASSAIFEMKRQQPKDIFDSEGIMQKGVIIRNLILPGNVSQSIKALDFIADNFSNETIVSLMSQYTPCGKSEEYPTINRRISKREYNTVLDHLEGLGFENAYVQELSSAKEEYIPPFDLTGV